MDGESRRLMHWTPYGSWVGTFNSKLTRCAHPDPSGFTSKFDSVVSQVATLDFSMSHVRLAVALRVFIVDTLIQNSHAPFFETVIRYLGGLLSAYALSGNPILLARADELGRKLLPVFNSPSGLPHYSVNTET